MQTLKILKSTLKNWLVQLLDRPGGRFFLGMLKTWLERRHTGTDIRFSYYNGIWVHRIGLYGYPDGPKLSNYNRHSADLADQYLANAKEFWFKYYRPQKGDVIFDVGAGRGEDTLAFSREVKETGRVIAIEGNPGSFEILKYFCDLNRLTNVTLLQVAVMDKPGIVSMTLSEDWQENGVVGVQNNDSPRVDVQAQTLSEICFTQGINKINFLKMNIEGAERFALIGLEPVIPRIETLCVACHDFLADKGYGEQFRTRGLVEYFLIEHGFKIFSRPNDPRDFVRNHIFGLRG
jgi:FkbM family methyltransferase